MHKFIKKIGPTKFSLSKNQRLVYVEKRKKEEIIDLTNVAGELPVTDICRITEDPNDLIGKILKYKKTESPTNTIGLEALFVELKKSIKEAKLILEGKPQEPKSSNPSEPTRNIMQKILGANINIDKLPETRNPKGNPKTNVLKEILDKKE